MTQEAEAEVEAEAEGKRKLSSRSEMEARVSQKTTFLKIQSSKGIFPFHLHIKCTMQSFRS